ncbi:MAG: hypothetical protein ABR510_09770 [Trueperaceae bacterium]
MNPSHVRAIFVLGATLLLTACSQLVDLRPVEVEVQLREAASDLQAGVRVRVVGAEGATNTFFGTVRPVPVLGPRLEVTLGAARLDPMPVVDVVPLLVAGATCAPETSNLVASNTTVGAAWAERFEVVDAENAVLGTARAATDLAAATAGRPMVDGDRVATYVYVDRPVRLTGVCSDGTLNVRAGIDLALGWNLVAATQDSATILSLSVLDRPGALPWHLVASE